MTLFLQDLGYLDGPYLEDPYLLSTVRGSLGFQSQGVITRQSPKGWQSTAVITKSNAKGMQALGVMTKPDPKGMQVLGVITDDRPKGWQSTAVITRSHPIGYQSLGIMTKPHATGWQVEGIITKSKAKGFQSLGVITRDRSIGWQSEGIITRPHPKGFQVISIRQKPKGWQATSVLYNVTQLRVLYNFQSRGLTGLNWNASSTYPTGHFGANNLNTDIVEELWRGASGVKSVNLDCDTQIPQGVFLDTFALLNHNLTTSATVILLGSNNPYHSPVGVQIPLLVTAENLFYIAPELPIKGWRYWRIAIDDPTQPGSYLQAGTCVFGPSEIFVRCFTQDVAFRKMNYKDSVVTEGFSSVANDRGIKKSLRLNFRNMQYLKTDYRKLSRIFDSVRTIQKALWIPTPQFATRFAVFAKLKDLPEESHNVISEQGDYISLVLEMDESI